MFKKCFRFAVFLTFILILFSAYSNTSYSPPALDDFHAFIDHSDIQARDFSVARMIALHRGSSGWSRWLPMVTFTFDAWLGNGDLSYLHATNFIIHLLCFFSVFFFIYQIAEAVRSRSETEPPLPASWELAFWVASLWALNPVQLNAVTYLVQRMASLAALFSVLSVASYIAARAAHIQSKTVNLKSVLLYFCSLASMGLALLSKQNSAVLPALLFLTEGWFFQPDLFERILRVCRKRWLLTIVLAGCLLLAGMQFLGPILAGYETRHFTLGQRLLTESRIVFWYISLLLFPAPHRLALEHDVEVSTSLIDPPTTILCLLALAVSVAAVIKYRRKYPIATYGVLWYLLNLSIESTVIPLELVFEHRIYLPSVGILLSLSVFVFAAARKLLSKATAKEFSTASWCVVSLLCAGLALTTFRCNEFWQNVVTLNQHNTDVAPNHPRAHANLAGAYVRAKQYDKGIAEARRAIELSRPNLEQYCVAANAIVIAYSEIHQDEKAIEEGEKLLESLPPRGDVQALPALRLNLALAYIRAGELQKAYTSAVLGLDANLHLSNRVLDPAIQDVGAEILCRMVEMAKAGGTDLDGDGKPDPGETPVDTWVAERFLQLGDRRKAEQLANRSLSANPADAEAIRIVETIHKVDATNRTQEANWSYRRKYMEHPFSSFNASMAGAIFICEQQLPPPFLALGEALTDRALELRPDSADAHVLKGWYHHLKGEFAAASVEARKAIELDPASAKAWLGLGFFQISLNQPQEAIASFQKTLEVYPGCPDSPTIHAIIRKLAESVS